MGGGCFRLVFAIFMLKLSAADFSRRFRRHLLAATDITPAISSFEMAFLRPAFFISFALCVSSADFRSFRLHFRHDSFVSRFGCRFTPAIFAITAYAHAFSHIFTSFAYFLHFRVTPIISVSISFFFQFSSSLIFGHIYAAAIDTLSKKEKFRAHFFACSSRHCRFSSSSVCFRQMMLLLFSVSATD
jgi:hypothetical protein